jgi:hypothetical protein
MPALTRSAMRNITIFAVMGNSLRFQKISDDSHWLWKNNAMTNP